MVLDYAISAQKYPKIVTQEKKNSTKYLKFPPQNNTIQYKTIKIIIIFTMKKIMIIKKLIEIVVFCRNNI